MGFIYLKKCTYCILLCFYCFYMNFCNCQQWRNKDIQSIKSDIYEWLLDTIEPMKQFAHIMPVTLFRIVHILLCHFLEIHVGGSPVYDQVTSHERHRHGSSNLRQFYFQTAWWAKTNPYLLGLYEWKPLVTGGSSLSEGKPSVSGIPLTKGQ